MKTVLVRILRAVWWLLMAPLIVAASVLGGTTNYYETLVNIIRGKE